MYVFNITFNVDQDIETKWLAYVKNEFIPQMLKSGLLRSSLTSKIIVEEKQGNSYSIQFTAKNKDDFKKFIKQEFFPIMNKLHLKFSPKVVYFATELEVIDKQ